MSEIVKFEEPVGFKVVQEALPGLDATKFYTFDQNNSGGGFDYQPEKGIGHYVIVEAYSVADANRRAEAIGLYFDGLPDCSCCGNRWSEQWSCRGEDPGTDVPELYGEPMEVAVRDTRSQSFNASLGGGEWRIFVHRIDGRIEAYR